MVRKPLLVPVYVMITVSPATGIIRAPNSEWEKWRAFYHKVVGPLKNRVQIKQGEYIEIV